MKHHERIMKTCKYSKIVRKLGEGGGGGGGGEGIFQMPFSDKNVKPFHWPEKL